MTEDEARELAKQEREQEWRARYAARIKAVTTCDDAFAQCCADEVVLDGIGYDVETDSPEDAADDDMATWSDDGD